MFITTNIINTHNPTKLYTLLIATLPILSIYYSGIPGINMGEFLLILFFIFDAFSPGRRKYSVHMPTEFIVFGVYVLFSTISSSLFLQSQILNVIVRTLRFTFYLITIIHLSNIYFSFDIFSKYIRLVSIFSTFYVIIQSILYRSFGFILKGFISFVPLYHHEYATFDYSLLYSTRFHRPTSIFLEPAHFAQYANFSLVFLLLNHKNKYNVLFAIFVTFGILISTSGLGLITALAIWGIYILNLIFANKQSSRKRLLGVSLVSLGLLSLPFIFKLDFVLNNLYRIFSRGESSAVGARSQGYAAFFSSNNLLIQIFGSGFGNTDLNSWYSGLAYILYCSGLLGFFILLWIFAKHFFKSKSVFMKVFVLTTFMLSASAEILNSYWIIFAFSPILYSYNDHLKKKVKIGFIHEKNTNIISPS